MFLLHAPLGERSIVINVLACLIVCLSVDLPASINPEIHVRSSPNLCAFVHVSYGCGSVLLCVTYLHCGFMDDITFAPNGPYEGMSTPLQRVTLLRLRHSQASAPAASYWLRRQRAARLDESFVQGVPGAEPATHHCFVYQQ